MGQTERFEAVGDLGEERRFFSCVFEFLVDFFELTLKLFHGVRFALILLLLLLLFECWQSVFQVVASQFLQRFSPQLQHAVFAATEYLVTDDLLCFELLCSHFVLLVSFFLILLLCLSQLPKRVFFTTLQRLDELSLAGLDPVVELLGLVDHVSFKLIRITHQYFQLFKIHLLI